MTYLLFEASNQAKVLEIINQKDIEKVKVEFKLKSNLTKEQIEKLRILEVGILTATS